MAGKDEVVLLASGILDRLRKDEDDQLSVFWRLFLTQTNDLRHVLKKRLKKRNWPVVYRSIEGKQILHISIAGACPSGILLGFVVWLCEAQYYNCDILCSIERYHLDRASSLVQAALSEKGWSLKLKSTSDHMTDVRFDGPGFDIFIVAHPENDDWLESLEFVRRDGCVLILNACRSKSFAMMEKMEGFEYAPPVVMDELPCDVTAFTASEWRAIESMRDRSATMASELPLSDEDSVATLYVKTTEPFTTSLSDSPTWSKSDTPRQNIPVMELPEVVDESKDDRHSCCVPRSFLYSGIELPSRLDAQGGGYRDYYRQLRNRRCPSRMELDGMGRPLLSMFYPDQMRRQTSHQCTSGSSGRK